MAILDPMVPRPPEGLTTPLEADLADVVAGRRRWLVYPGDVRAGLARLPANSVQCVMTSPPYWGPRDYSTKPQTWGDGWRGELGREPTPDQYVAHLVEVFEGVRRVLRLDGTLWLNIGDTYAGGGRGPTGKTGVGNHEQRQGFTGSTPVPSGLKAKDLVGIPWMLAFALRSAGWHLRADIIWHKSNPMPSSVLDRTTLAHEYVFLLTKSSRYYYDQVAIMEDAVHAGKTVRLGERSLSRGLATGAGRAPSGNALADSVEVAGQRNLRSVWTIPTGGYSGEHYAAYPEQLCERPLKAGTSWRGCCPRCGAPWRRVVETTDRRHWTERRRTGALAGTYADGSGGRHGGTEFIPAERTTAGWQPTCKCPEQEPIGCLVLDPFCGTGTTGVVALQLGQRFIGLELNEDYVRLAERRIRTSGGLMAAF